MRRYLTALGILVILFCGCGEKKDVETKLTPAEFTEAFAARLTEMDDGLTCHRNADLELKLETAEGEDHNVFLDNAYREYLAAPEDIERVLSGYSNAALETLRSPDVEQVVIESVVPVIKDAAYPRDAMKSLSAKGYDTEKLELYYEPLNEQLVILYASDTEYNVKYLNCDMVKSLGLKPDALRQRAIDNLKTICPPIQKHGQERVFMVTAGGTYETSLLLLDSIWSSEIFPVQGDIVIAVPSRDVLLVTGSEDTEGLDQLREAAKKLVSKGSYYLTADLFVRRDGKWTRFNE
ncbi:MAG: DUF1444 family protein [Pirellulales bacterium]|nr:DUF1444 family protein [Pirellulales bacterium]